MILLDIYRSPWNTRLPVYVWGFLCSLRPALLLAPRGREREWEYNECSRVLCSYSQHFAAVIHKRNRNCLPFNLFFFFFFSHRLFNRDVYYPFAGFVLETVYRCHRNCVGVKWIYYSRSTGCDDHCSKLPSLNPCFQLSYFSYLDPNILCINYQQNRLCW